MTKNKGGRPKLASAVTTIGVVLPTKLAALLKTRAKKDGKTLSELVREVLESRV